MGTKEQGDMCYAAAMPEEPMFVLLARDPNAPDLVRRWADQREAEVITGDRPADDMNKVEEARDCADNMEHWRKENLGIWRSEP